MEIDGNRPYNTKFGGVCVYCKKALPFKLINKKYLQKCMSFEVRTGEKCFKFICLYRSPSQTNDEFESSLKNFELSLDKIHEENLFMIAVFDDFYAKF